MTPQQLSVASVPFKGVPEGRKPDIALYLLNAILAGGGGGGGGGAGNGGILQVGVNGWGGPPAIPPDPTKPWISYPSGGGGESQWDVASQSWI